jgi:hypothetical protein
MHFKGEVGRAEVKLSSGSGFLHEVDLKVVKKKGCFLAAIFIFVLRFLTKICDLKDRRVRSERLSLHSFTRSFIHPSIH